MSSNRARRLAGRTLAIALIGLAATPLMAVGRQQVSALGTVKPGLYQLRSADGGPAGERVCIADPGALVQIEHRTGACSRLVIADSSRAATVHYSCPGTGWGRTSLRVVSADAVRIDTQGVAGQAPFAYRAEARRTGNCVR